MQHPSTLSHQSRHISVRATPWSQIRLERTPTSTTGHTGDYTLQHPHTDILGTSRHRCMVLWTSIRSLPLQSFLRTRNKGHANIGIFSLISLTLHPPDSHTYRAHHPGHTRTSTMHRNSSTGTPKTTAHQNHFGHQDSGHNSTQNTAHVRSSHTTMGKLKGCASPAHNIHQSDGTTAHTDTATRASQTHTEQHGTEFTLPKHNAHTRANCRPDTNRRTQHNTYSSAPTTRTDRTA